MKLASVILLSLFLLLNSCTQPESLNPTFYSCRANLGDVNVNHPEAARYQQLLDDLTRRGIPGIIMSIHTPEHGLWMGASGKADIHNQVPMQPCYISRAGSTVKTFTATAIMMLAQEKKLSLDDLVSQYLPPSVLSKLENGEQCTIRQLLNHSSGIYNYIQDLKFQTASLNDLRKVWQPEELLSYAYHRKAYFAPGHGITYSNTGYILLGMIIERVSGQHFTQFFKERIFDPLQLELTQFDPNDPVPTGLVRGYTDLYSNYNLIESTYYSGWDYFTADGGLISNPRDLSVFLRALFAGKIINKQYLAEMQQWIPKVKANDFFPMDYGLGIFRIKTPYGYAFFHSGDAIGYFATMIYFPEKETTIVWMTNGLYGKIDELNSSQQTYLQIFKTVFNE